MKHMMLVLALVVSGADAMDGKLKSVYLDKNAYVHVVTEAGSDISMHAYHRGVRPMLSPNRNIAAWLIEEKSIGEFGTELGVSWRSIRMAKFVQ